MSRFRNKKFITVIMLAVLVLAGMFNRNYSDSSNEETAKILGEAAYVNNNVIIEEKDTEKQLKNDRRVARDETKEMLQEIIDNPSTTDEGRKNAESALIKLAKSITDEVDCEAILKQKGFDDAVVTITEGGARVSVKTKDLMNTEIAQITETISSVTGLESEKIKILSGD